MAKSNYQPIYDITKTFEENLQLGPNPAYRAEQATPPVHQKYELFGFKLNSPFGASASPTGADSRFIKAMFDSGFDVVTTKTRRSVHYRPNQFPNIVHIVPGKIRKDHNFEALASRTSADTSHYRTLTIANSYGNNSLDPSYWVPDAELANSYAGPGQLLITSIVGTIQQGFSTVDYYNDFAKTAVLAKNSGARVIEINFSCPNVLNQGVLCYDHVAVEAICQLVKQAVGNTPIIAKLGYFPPNEDNDLGVVVRSIAPYVAGISAINTFAAPIYDENGQQALPGKGRLKAGLSGHAIKDLGLDMTTRLAKIRQNDNLGYTIIGIGGVLAASDFHDYRKAGADVVLSATGAMFNADLANEIKASL
ncbi:MAG TPA: hypothetical protein VG604_00665 [Candidatus Saccharimonadales bacterium]|nr:hypothetical protein [Candidatus Saccharimonadales bacterium]